MKVGRVNENENVGIELGFCNAIQDLYIIPSLPFFYESAILCLLFDDAFCMLKNMVSLPESTEITGEVSYLCFNALQGSFSEDKEMR